MKPLRILLADDHSVVLEGLRRILDRPEFEIAGMVRDGRALVQAAAKLNPDVIVVDVTMPVLNGIDAVRQIRRDDQTVKVVFLSMHPEVPYACEALAAGASAYVLKSSAGEELVTAIRTACKGQTFITAAIAQPVRKALASRSREQKRDLGGLTPRQREILQLLAEGHAVKEIAAMLHISPRTVEFHKYAVMQALGAGSTADLTRFAAKHGIVA